MEVNIEDLLENVLESVPKPPKSISITLDSENLKEMFEFLLDFVTKIFKTLYSDERGVVDLEKLSDAHFNTVDQYMQSIGFKCNFNAMPATHANLTYLYQNRYDKIEITRQTKLADLFFAIKCSQKVYCISFSFLV